MPRFDTPELADATNDASNERDLLTQRDLKEALAVAHHSLLSLGVRTSDQLNGHGAWVMLERAVTQAGALADVLLERERRRTSVRVTLDLNAFLSGLEAGLRARLSPDVALVVRRSAVSAWIHADPVLLAGVLGRLVDGACCAMPHGGEVSISTGWLDQIEAAAEYGESEPERFVRLTVSDTGEGPATDVHARVLDPGFDHEGHPVRESLRAEIGRLRGSLLLESEAGAGSRIHVLFRAIGTD